LTGRFFTRRRAGLRLAGAALACAAVLAACGEDKPTDQTYCEALATAAVSDASALMEGDKAALDEALESYQKLRDLAPSTTTKQWALIVRDLESMLEAARGGIPVSETDYPGFRDALAEIEADIATRCE
jgi:hypothetical protein